MRRARYDGLTVAQTRVLGEIAMQSDGPFSKSVIDVLLKRGLIESRQVELADGGWPPVMLTIYELPLHEHMRYCQWCADESPSPLAANEAET